MVAYRATPLHASQLIDLARWANEESADEGLISQADILHGLIAEAHLKAALRRENGERQELLKAIER